MNKERQEDKLPLWVFVVFPLIGLLFGHLVVEALIFAG